MKAASRFAFFLGLVVLSVAVSAQRGGGRGRGAGAGNTAAVAPTLLTGFDSDEYGLKFPAPPKMSVFTPAHPWRFGQILTERRIVYLVDLMGTSASVIVKYTPGATDADVRGLQTAYESNPPQAKLPGYRKISLRMIKIGAHADKDALEFVYTAKENEASPANAPRDDGREVVDLAAQAPKVVTTRQVVFAHKGNGFTFICTAAEKDFALVDKTSFERLFATIEFK